MKVTFDFPDITGDEAISYQISSETDLEGFFEDFIVLIQDCENFDVKVED